jgi:acyl-CoA synthetase (AMP-forming)/AMP-acid ligase II
VHGVQLLVLNASNQLAGVGELGEICAHVCGLEPSQFGDIGLKEWFVRNPLTQISAKWLLRTHDLGRYLPDGNVQLVGSIDGRILAGRDVIQVEDIEALLLRHPAVQQAGVTVKLGTESHIVACIVLARGGHEVCTALYKKLKEQLPSSMAPSSVIAVPMLPLKGNGRLDRAALAELPQAEEMRRVVGARSSR